MSVRSERRMIWAILVLCLLFCCSCGGGSDRENGSDRKETAAETKTGDTAFENSAPVSGGHRESPETFLFPEPMGEVTYGIQGIDLDASLAKDGVVMIRYQNDSDQVRVQILYPDETIYTYVLRVGNYETFPLTGGSGMYEIRVLEHAYDSKYAIAFSQEIEVNLENEFLPYLYPNQYVWYTQSSPVTAFAGELSQQSADDLSFVAAVYDYVIENVEYDQALAENVPLNYIPDINVTFETNKGICFDYASLMSAMLRSQGIPTKLVVGYSGEAYHAWISVYIKEIGWVDNVIQFDGKNWSLMDPTLAANNQAEQVKEYVGDGSNYTVKYWY